MGDVIVDLAHLRHHGLHVCRHAVEGAHQVVDFPAMLGGRDPVGKMAVGDALRRPGHGLHAGHRLARQGPARQRAQAQHEEQDEQAVVPEVAKKGHAVGQGQADLEVAPRIHGHREYPGPFPGIGQGHRGEARLAVAHVRARQGQGRLPGLHVRRHQLPAPRIQEADEVIPAVGIVGAGGKLRLEGVGIVGGQHLDHFLPLAHQVLVDLVDDVSSHQVIEQQAAAAGHHAEEQGVEQSQADGDGTPPGGALRGRGHSPPRGQSGSARRRPRRLR